jgi:hypothetical protein
MNTITIPNYDTIEEAARWVKDNEKNMKNTERITIDFSECRELYSCIVGFVINLLTYYRTKNIMCTVIRPESIILKSVFNGVFEYFGV